MDSVHQGVQVMSVVWSGVLPNYPLRRNLASLDIIGGCFIEGDR